MKAREFASGEHSPQILDIDMFKYECINVLGMDDMEDDEFFLLARYLIEHFYQIPKRDREYLRYTVSEA